MELGIGTCLGGLWVMSVLLGVMFGQYLERQRSKYVTFLREDIERLMSTVNKLSSMIGETPEIPDIK